MAALKKLLAALVLCTLVAAPLTTNALSCDDVATYLFPCIGYLRSGQGSPPGSCCGGVRSVNAGARTTPERQFTCNCLKSAANGIPGINVAAAAGLPGKCSVSIPYKISPDADCSKVK